jgi:hypothetical protein
VASGLFTTPLDFGLEALNGQARWLEIAVRTNGSAVPYTVLTPRTAIQSTPYALHALAGGSQTLKIVSGATQLLPYTGYEFVFPTPGVTNASTNVYAFERTCVAKVVQDVRILLMQRPTNTTPVFVRAEVWGVAAAAYPNQGCTTYLQEYASFRRAITVETNISSVPAGTWTCIPLATGTDLGVGL